MSEFDALSDTVAKSATFAGFAPHASTLFASMTNLEELEKRRAVLFDELRKALGYKLVQLICDVINKYRPGSNYRVRSWKQQPDYWPVRVKMSVGFGDAGAPVRTLDTTADKLRFRGPLIETKAWYEIDRADMPNDKRRWYFSMHMNGQFYYHIDTPIPTTEEELLALLKLPHTVPDVPSRETTSDLPSVSG